MPYLANLAVGHKYGIPRVYLQSKQLDGEGFSVGQKIDITMDANNKVIRIRADGAGKRVVSRRRAGGTETPVIDLHSLQLAHWMPSHATRVRVLARDGVIEIVVHRDDDALMERLSRFYARMAKGLPLQVGEIAAGAGIMSDAMHQGFLDKGVTSEIAFAVEKEPACMAQFKKVSRATTPDTLFAETGICLRQSSTLEPKARRSA